MPKIEANFHSKTGQNDKLEIIIGPRGTKNLFGIEAFMEV